MCVLTGSCVALRKILIDVNFAVSKFIKKLYSPEEPNNALVIGDLQVGRSGIFIQLIEIFELIEYLSDVGTVIHCCNFQVHVVLSDVVTVVIHKNWGLLEPWKQWLHDKAHRQSWYDEQDSWGDYHDNKKLLISALALQIWFWECIDHNQVHANFLRIHIVICLDWNRVVCLRLLQLHHIQ